MPTQLRSRGPSANEGLVFGPSATARSGARTTAGSSSSSSLSSSLSIPAFPLASFFRPAEVSVSRWVTISAVLMLAGLFRWAVSLWDYSGFNSPPMFGDFEAQRHWMELTTNVPVSQWYFHDLDWWGLDYPPLTAYHSWILGKVGSLFDPQFFAFKSSRGLETAELKLFMRASALASEFVVLIPALCVFTQRLGRLKRLPAQKSTITLAAVLLAPTLMLIDHGHFQYNSIMLGFFVASLNDILAGRWLLSCVWFVSALCFKQMALFYAPAMFAYILGSFQTPRPASRTGGSLISLMRTTFAVDVGRLSLIGITTILAFAVFYLPLIIAAIVDSSRGTLLPSDIVGTPLPPLMTRLLSWIPLDRSSVLYAIALQLTQSIHRVFPFARGLFEDKVANLWCALHTFHKLHQYPSWALQRASLALTAGLIVPPCVCLFVKARRDAIVYSLDRINRSSPSPNSAEGLIGSMQVCIFGFATVAWGFFLASYQVHEKNVLLPLLPMTLLLASHGYSARIRGWVGFANMVGAWTVFPLLSRDGLRTPYFVVTLLWAWLLGLPPVDWSLYSFYGPKPEGRQLDWAEKFVHVTYYFVMVGWHLAEAFVAPPEGKPDLWVVLNVLVGASAFGLCYLWCLTRLVRESGVLGKRAKRKKQ